jgi:hypothetical protein
MSVEGMWVFRVAELAAPTVPRFGGIVVLETGRVFGGDSMMAYIGEYNLNHGNITARVQARRWNPEGEVENVFGMSGDIDFVAILDGQLNGSRIDGHLAPEGAPDARVAAELVRIADLP